MDKTGEEVFDVTAVSRVSRESSREEPICARHTVRGTVKPKNLDASRGLIG